jgi:predicted nucleic acid-binding protein
MVGKNPKNANNGLRGKMKEEVWEEREERLEEQDYQWEHFRQVVKNIAAVPKEDMDELLREGYEEMGKHDKKLLKEFENVDRETSWSEYSENE